MRICKLCIFLHGSQVFFAVVVQIYYFVIVISSTKFLAPDFFACDGSHIWVNGWIIEFKRVEKTDSKSLNGPRKLNKNFLTKRKLRPAKINFCLTNLLCFPHPYYRIFENIRIKKNIASLVGFFNSLSLWLCPAEWKKHKYLNISILHHMHIHRLGMYASFHIVQYIHTYISIHICTLMVEFMHVFLLLTLSFFSR